MDELSRLKQYRKTFEPEDVLVEEGDRCDGFYILSKGKVEVRVQGRKVGEISAGKSLEFIGEVGALLSTPRTARVVALTDVETLFIPNSDLESLLANAPSLGIKLARSLSRKLLNTDQTQSESWKHYEKILQSYMKGLLAVMELAVKRNPHEATESILNYFRLTNPWSLGEGDAEEIVDQRVSLDLAS